jgi:hypothetical protein
MRYVDPKVLEQGAHLSPPDTHLEALSQSIQDKFRGFSYVRDDDDSPLRKSQ